MSFDSSSEIALVTLVTFRYGANTFARYTSSLSQIIDIDGTFDSEPTLEVVMNAQNGGSADVPVQLRMKLRPPLDALTSQRSHSPVRVTIEEADPGDLSTRHILFAGMVKTSHRNLDGRTGIVQLEIAGWKYSLEVAANSWQANTTCNNVFGDDVCGKDLEAIRETASVTDIDGNFITLSGLATTAVEGHWRFGYLEYDGLRIKVREYTTGNQLELLKTPPASWQGQTVTATPGCDKRLATCRDKWDRESQFTGFGLKIPAYNPLLEST